MSVKEIYECDECQDYIEPYRATWLGDHLHTPAIISHEVTPDMTMDSVFGESKPIHLCKPCHVGFLKSAIEYLEENQ